MKPLGADVAGAIGALVQARTGRPSILLDRVVIRPDSTDLWARVSADGGATWGEHRIRREELGA